MPDKVGDTFVEFRIKGLRETKEQLDKLGKDSLKTARIIERGFKETKLKTDVTAIKTQLADIERSSRAVERRLAKQKKFNVDVSEIQGTNRALLQLQNNATKLKGDLKKAEKALRDFGQTGLKNTNKLTGAFRKLRLGVLSSIGGVIALKKAFDLAVVFKNAARDAEEVRNKFNEVFREIRGEANKMALSLAKDFKLAKSTAQSLLGETGDLLVGFGFTSEKALTLSDSIVRIASDLVSFKNIAGGTVTVVDAIISSMSGIVQASRAFGVVISQRDAGFRKLIKTYQEVDGLTFQQARSLAVLDEIYRQSPRAIGDFARTQHELANRERILNEELKETKELLGAEFQTAILVIMKSISDFNKEIQSSNSELSAFGGIMKTVVNLILVIGRVLKGIGTHIGGVTAALVQLGKLEFSAAFEAIKITLDKQIDNFKGFKDDFIAVWGDVIEASKINVDKFNKSLEGLDDKALREKVNSIADQIEKLENKAVLISFSGIDESLNPLKKAKPIPSLFEKGAESEPFKKTIEQVARLKEELKVILDILKETSGTEFKSNTIGDVIQQIKKLTDAQLGLAPGSEALRRNRAEIEKLEGLLKQPPEKEYKKPQLLILIDEFAAAYKRLAEEKDRAAAITAIFGVDTSEQLKPTTEGVQTPEKPILEMDDAAIALDQTLNSLGDAATRAGQAMSSSLARAIVQGESLANVLNNVLQMFAQIALQSLFTTAIGSVSGGGLLGSLFGSEAPSAGGGGQAGVISAVNQVSTNIRASDLRASRADSRPQPIFINIDGKQFYEGSTAKNQNNLESNNKNTSQL